MSRISSSVLRSNVRPSLFMQHETVMGAESSIFVDLFFD
jgi:hypothetical protein